MDEALATSGDGRRRLLSVVIGTTQPWPETRAVLDSVYESAQAIGAEIVLAVRDEAGRPPRDAYPAVQVVAGPGESVFELRMRAIAESSGEIVAVTEDHCLVAPDWCRRVLDAHAEFPEADVIGGAVANGACSPSDWASFLISNGAFLPPLETRERPIVTGHANVSFKRRALWGWGAGGLDDGRYRTELRGCGGQLLTDGRIEVSHVQSMPPLAMCIYQFHGGRALAGTQRAHLSGWRSWRRLGKVLLLPVRVVLNTPRLAIRAAMHDPTLWKPMLRCQPWLALILTFYFSGELVGHLAGPGKSPNQLR